MNPFRRLRRAGVLGLNERNARYVSRWNARRLYPLVDDKLKTKELALKAGIAVPEPYAVLSKEWEIRDLERRLGGYGDFVVKPAHGSGGNGILVIVDRRGDRFCRSNGRWIDLASLRHHVSNILGGVYSLGGRPDRALVEYRVQFDTLFEKICYQGVPDIRTVVYRGFPVMAMVRLPTSRSGGCANLHQGAVGAAIDVATGATGSGVWLDRFTSVHPDTGECFVGLEIPGWDALLETAARCYDFTGLGYLGVDMVLDRHRGPLMLELNARPGISIQIANRLGLRPRLQAVDLVADAGLNAAGRVAYSRECFAADFGAYLEEQELLASAEGDEAPVDR